MPSEDSRAFPCTPTRFQKVPSNSTLKPLSETSPPRHPVWPVLGVYRAIDMVGKNVRNLQTGERTRGLCWWVETRWEGPGRGECPWVNSSCMGGWLQWLALGLSTELGAVQSFPSLKSEHRTQLSPGSLDFTFLVSEWRCFTALGVTTECARSSALRGRGEVICRPRSAQAAGRPGEQTPRPHGDGVCGGGWWASWRVRRGGPPACSSLFIKQDEPLYEKQLMHFTLHA